MPAERLEETSLSEFDNSPYLPNGPQLELILGQDLGRMMIETERVAPKFWGVRKNLYAVEDNFDTHNRLIQLRKILRMAPVQEPEINDWAFNRSAADMLKVGNSALQSSVTIVKAKSGGKLNRPALKKTYREIMTDPSMVTGLMDSLLVEEDPAAEAVGMLEQWRHSREEAEAPTLNNLLEGVEAFHIFLFAVHKTKLKKMVGDLAIKNHK